mgnify:CR=1 FL=1
MVCFMDLVPLVPNWLDEFGPGRAGDVLSLVIADLAWLFCLSSLSAVKKSRVRPG